MRRLRRRPSPPPPAAERWRQHFATIDGIAAACRPEMPGRLWPTRAATRKRVAQLATGERHEHLTINNEPVVSAESKSAGEPLDRRLAARGCGCGSSPGARSRPGRCRSARSGTSRHHR
ncbi:hypothetical protein [Paractinoplanes durhamensis]|uniref:hypothetical protein n=1 Tax=Paractinoplanes durhamensis TaxID=113563 RepID=UPI003641CA21